MKKILFTLLIAAFAATCMLTVADMVLAGDDEKESEWTLGSNETVKWLDYSKSKSKLKRNEKPLLFYFYSKSGEDFCREFETEIFTNGTVKIRSRKCLCFMINSEEESELLKEFKLSKGDAAVILTDFQRTEFKRYTAVVKDRDFADDLQDLYEDSKKKEDMLDKLEKAAKLAKKYFKRRMYKEGFQVWDQILEQKGKIQSDVIDEIEKEYAAIKKKAKREVDAAIKQANQTYNRYAGVSTNSNTGSLSSAESALRGACVTLTKVRQKYPFSEVEDAIMPVENRIMSKLNSISAELRRRQEEQQKKQNP